MIRKILLSLTLLVMMAHGTETAIVDQVKEIMHNHDIPQDQKLLTIYRVLLQKCMALSAEKNKLEQQVVELEQQLAYIQSAHEAALRELEQLRSPNGPH